MNIKSIRHLVRNLMAIISLGAILTLGLVGCAPTSTTSTTSTQSTASNNGGSSTTQTNANVCPALSSETACNSVTPYCGDDCDNSPYCAATCATSKSGPPWSGGSYTAPDGTSTGMLYCPKATYALCHFSGPRTPTGTNPDNIPLPCKLNASGTVANCKCQVFEGGSYLNMPAILNLGAFYETVDVCGPEGSKCKNQLNCPNGECDDSIPVAPACKYVVAQDADKPETSLVPGADLISTFSEAMQNNYPAGSTQCTNIFRAGCMAAPCWYEEDDKNDSSPARYAQCACATYFYSSASLSQDNLNCNAGDGYVWE